MSAAPSEPTPSPIPLRPAPPSTSQPTSTTRPHPKPALPTPKLLLKATDLTHPGASIFFSANNPASALSSAVTSALSTLYHPTPTNRHIPPTRSVTLVLRPMDGVAYTTGTALDNDHKEIHFSLTYIAQIPAALQTSEIMGVLVHEMVHCWQWDALSTAPGGLIEGIADFVRLKAGLSPPHWKKEAGGDWDAGYQHTGYFLEWLEERFGAGSVEKVNAGLKGKKYVEAEFWTGLFGKGVGELWREYGRALKREVEGAGEGTDDEGVLVEREDEAGEDEGKKGGKTEAKEQVEAEVTGVAKMEAKGNDANKTEVQVEAEVRGVAKKATKGNDANKTEEQIEPKVKEVPKKETKGNGANKTQEQVQPEVRGVAKVKAKGKNAKKAEAQEKKPLSYFI